MEAPNNQSENNKKRGKFLIPLSAGILLGVALCMLVFFSPLHSFLPLSLDRSSRAELVRNALRIDSLEHENDLRTAYLTNLTNILRDQVKTDSLLPYDTVVSRIEDTLLVASQREQAFTLQYENQERFGLNPLLNDNRPSVLLFMSPAVGEILTPQESADEWQGVRLLLPKEMPVLAPLEGTVVAVVYQLGEGWTIVLQHANDYVCLFSHLSMPMVEEGQPVKQGRVIGHCGSQPQTDDRWLGIRVWHKGAAEDPASLMQLEK